MIFRPELAKLIRQGKKSQTRRIVGDAARCRYEAGKSYAVQPGRGKPALCRITILSVRREALGELTLKDARREGFVTTDEFFDYWRGLYGAVDRDLPVWVLSFALGDLTDEPRMLAARPGAPHGDYVTVPYLAMDGEPEALSASDTEHFGKLAHARDVERRKDPDVVLRNGLLRELRQWEDRTGGVTDRDRQKAIDGIARQLRALDRKIKAA